MRSLRLFPRHTEPPGAATVSHAPSAAAARHGSRALTIAALLFAVIFVLRVISTDPDHMVGLLYTIPVMMVAIELGALAGVTAGVLAVALSVGWDLGADTDPSQDAGFYVIRGVLVMVIGASVGLLADRLRASAEAQARFWELSTDLLVTASAEGYLLSVNPAWERELGWSAEELTSRRFLEFVHPDDRERTEMELTWAGSGRNSFNFENRYRTRDGSYRMLQWKATSDPNREVIYATARDITESVESAARLREAVEEANHANRAKSEFLSRMSHELRTPLNAILGFAQLLELAELEPRHHDAAVQIREGGQHLLRLIEELLDLSVIELDKASISLEPVSAAGALEGAMALIEPLATEAEVQLVSERLDPGLTVLADSRRLKQVLINLLANAIKYNERHVGVVRVGCERKSGGRISIAVRDNGPGMSAEQLSKVFTPFERFGAERSGTAGMGLGLPLSRRLVELMGGTLEPRSELGAGTTMEVELASAGRADQPAAEAPRANEPTSPDEALPADDAIDLATGPAESGRSVVYVEDDGASVRMVERALGRAAGMQVVCAADGRRGLQLVRDARPAMVLLDLNLPGLDGVEVLRRLKGDPETAATPVVVISADATPGQAERLRREGALEYLTKPIDVDQLLALVTEHSGTGTG